VGFLIQALVAIPVRLLRPFVVVRLVRFHTPFGFVLRCPFYYLLRREAEREAGSEKFFDVVFWSGSRPDTALSKLFGRHIRLVQHPALSRVARALHVIAWYWQRRPEMNQHVVDYSDISLHSSNFMNSIKFSARSLMSDSEHRDVTICLERLGVNPAARVALIHVRNDSHDTHDKLSHSYDVNCVNADPSGFQSSVDYLKSVGFEVLTIGNHPSSPSGLRGVVEYHSSPVRTPLRDFTLGSIASLYLGTASGALSGVAFQFRIPFLLTNHVVWGSNFNAEFLAYGRGVVLLKNTFLDGEAVPLSKCLNSHLPIGDRALAARNVTLQENSSEEMLVALQYLLSLGDSDEKWQAARLGSEQGAFWSVFDEHTLLQRVCKRDGVVVSPSYLSKNPHWLR